MKKNLTLLVLLTLFAFYTYAQGNANLTGVIQNYSGEAVAYASIHLYSIEHEFIKGTLSTEKGNWALQDIPEGSYIITVTSIGYDSLCKEIQVGKLSSTYHLGIWMLHDNTITLDNISIEAPYNSSSIDFDKKSYSIKDLTVHRGGSIAEALKSLPGVTVTPEGIISLRGSENVAILMNGQQNALTGFASQNGLDNIPASAIETIEIINNPSARYDAAGQAGVINIILKKQNKNGLNGQIGFSYGVGSIVRKKENLPTINKQYRFTPKYNPSITLNYRTEKSNLFLQSDFLWHKRVNRNEFFEKIEQNEEDNLIHQYLENRTQNIPTVRAGVDLFIKEGSTLTLSGNYSRKAYVDRGSLPFFTTNMSSRKRLWLFKEDETENLAAFNVDFKRHYSETGKSFQSQLGYTHIIKKEYYNLDNITDLYEDSDYFELNASQYIIDYTFDFNLPFSRGLIESGTKIRYRFLPIDIDYLPGTYSPIDVNAGGWADYHELIPALYSTFLYELNNWEIDAGLRGEFVNVDYKVTPEHNTYKSDGYRYLKIFPNINIKKTLAHDAIISLFYNKRVDRPEEKQLRIFPKYDDPQILSIGNPRLKPQYTDRIELGLKKGFKNNYLYSAIFSQFTKNFISPITTSTTQDDILYNISQNTGGLTNFGLELILNISPFDWWNINGNLNYHYKKIGAFEIENQYPQPVYYRAPKKTAYAGNLKVTQDISLPNSYSVQIYSQFMTKDILPQAEIKKRYSIDTSIKKVFDSKKAEVFFNATDIFNTLVNTKIVTGEDFLLVSTDFFETQVLRLGISYRF